MRGIDLVVSVWGPHSKRFLEHSLPHLLSYGNLPDLRHPGDWRFFLNTSIEDLEVIAAHPGIASVKEIMPVEIAAVGPVADLVHDPFKYVNASYLEALARAYRRKAGVYAFWPDQIMSRGSLVYAEKAWLEGYRCFMNSGYRALYEPFIAALEAEKQPPALPGQGVTAAVLTRLTLDNIHPWTLSLTLDRVTRAIAPRTAGLYARLNADALAILTWQADPVLFDPAFASDRFEHDLDRASDLAIPLSTTLEAGQIYYTCDTDNYFAPEFSTMEKGIQYRANSPADHEIVSDEDLARVLADYFLREIYQRRPRLDLAFVTFDKLAIAHASTLASIPTKNVDRMHAIRERAVHMVRSEASL